MFTGLVQEIGKVTRVQHAGGAMRWTIYAPESASRLKVGDSINVAGACQTVESVHDGSISGTAIAQTLAKTTFLRWKIGTRVNLELALRADDRLGGHMVSGHIDTVGKVLRRRDSSSETKLPVVFDDQFNFWVVAQGSVALDGVSLTIAEKGRGQLTVALIPETLRRTTLGDLRPGDAVNIEFDQLVKAVVQQASQDERKQSHVDANLLARSGW